MKPFEATPVPQFFQPSSTSANRPSLGSDTRLKLKGKNLQIITGTGELCELDRLQ